MEEKNATKISLSTFLLILAIITIIVMGIFIYKLNNDKTIEIQKSTELQAQVNSLNGTVSDLQGKINSISETINSSKDSKNNNINNINNSNSNSDEIESTENSIRNQNKNNSIEFIEGKYCEDNVIENSDNGAIYYFSNGNVMRDTLAIYKGKYIVEGNKLKITFYEAYDPPGPPEGAKLDINEDEKNVEFIIINESTLLNEKNKKTYTR